MFSVDELKTLTEAYSVGELPPSDKNEAILAEPVALAASQVLKERPEREVVSLKKITARTLKKERSLAISLSCQSEKGTLEPREKEIVLRQKREFQKSLKEAWHHFDSWQDQLRMQPATLDSVENCLLAEPLQVLIICQLIKESYPALYYYVSLEDSTELCRFVASLLLCKRLTEMEYAGIKGISVMLPDQDDVGLEPLSLESAREMHCKVEQVVAASVDQFIQDCLIEGSVSVVFKGCWLTGASYTERCEALDVFLSKIREHVTLMLQEKDNGFFLKLQSAYPFDPEAIQNRLSLKIKEMMKLDGSVIEAAAFHLSLPDHEVTLIPAKMTWLILSCLNRRQFQKKISRLKPWLEELFFKKKDRAAIQTKKIEITLQGDLNGMMAKIVSALWTESKSCPDQLFLHSGYKADVLLLPSSAEGESSFRENNVYPSSHRAVVPFNCHLLQTLDRIVAPFAEGEMACSLEKLVQFLKWLSLFIQENHQLSEEVVKQFLTHSGGQKDFLSRSAVDEETLFIVTATQILREGVAASDKFRRVVGKMQGGFLLLRALFKEIENSFDGSVTGLLAMKEKMSGIGWKCHPEGWFCLVDLLDGSLRNLLLRKETHIALSVPKETRSYSELAWDAIYQSERAEDIDWKCQRYLEILRQLKTKCQVLTLPDDSGLFSKETLSIQAKSLSRQQLDTLRSNFTDTFLKGLRSKLTDDQIFAKGEISPYLRVAETLMTEMNLDEPALAMLDKFVSWGSSLLGDESKKLPKGNSVSMVEGFEEIWKCLNAVPVGAKRPPMHQIASSARGRWNVDFDPIRQGNLPHILGKLHFMMEGAETIVKALAFGSPTIEGAFSYAVLTPEFKASMALYQLLGKSHLFVLNQNQIPSWRILGEVETDRVDAINTFAEEKVPGSLFVLVLSKNSPFYYQTGEFAEMSSAILFKDAFIKQLFDLPKSVTGNSFSANLLKKVPDLRKKTIEMIEAVHQFLFSGKSDLEKEERLLFIDSVQSMLTLFLIMELGVVSFNISCKDAIDRAIVSYALLLALVALLSHKNQDPAFRRKYFMVVFARALMVRKRPIFYDRLERILSGVRGFEKRAEELERVFEAFFKGCSVCFV